MRHSPWSLLLLATSIVAVAYAAVFLPSLHRGSGKRESDGAILLEWQSWEPTTGSLVAEVLDSSQRQNIFLKEWRLRVLVEDQDGNPISNASIQCELLTETSVGTVLEGKSNTKGQFASPRLEAGHYQVTIRKTGFLPSQPRSWQLPCDSKEMTPIRLQAGSLIRGHLNGTDGAPRNHGVLLLTHEKDGQVLEVATDKHGVFQFPAASRGKWQLTWLRHRQAESTPNLTRSITCSPGEDWSVTVTLPDRNGRQIAASDSLNEGIYVVSNPK